ncbi:MULTISPECIES: anaerobic dehydrogenase [Rhizobium]|uniref:anaerobic dehydrogenase n=1 Tax=Rhizobium TaxID=379 RepID=UPI00041F724C|nr:MULTISPECIES: anaerobic dehydrogenase [Rhizobium]UFS82021.1 anaerobic dehydrogenase [Rhizobium sp. T136]
MLERCVGPVDLGDKELTLALLEFYWKKDRARLLSCVRKHLELVDFYADRDAGLTGKAVQK